MNNIEELRKIAQEEMEKQIKENINSSLIFKYVSDLEKENKILTKTNNENAKSVLDVEKSYKDLLEKIRAKIRELENMRDTTITSEGFNILNGEIVVLKELLGEDEK